MAEADRNKPSNERFCCGNDPHCAGGCECQCHTQAKEIERLTAERDELQAEVYTRRQGQEVLEGDIRELHAALERSADTFADFNKGLRLLNRPLLADACEIAEKDARAALTEPQQSLTAQAADFVGTDSARGHHETILPDGSVRLARLPGGGTIAVTDEPPRCIFLDPLLETHVEPPLCSCPTQPLTGAVACCGHAQAGYGVSCRKGVEAA